MIEQENQKDIFTETPYIQILSNLHKSASKWGDFLTLFLYLGVPLWCPTSVSHLKSRVLGIKKTLKIKVLFENGGRAEIRTLGPLIKSQLLYQLSYAPHECLNYT